MQQNNYTWCTVGNVYISRLVSISELMANVSINRHIKISLPTTRILYTWYALYLNQRDKVHPNISILETAESSLIGKKDNVARWHIIGELLTEHGIVRQDVSMVGIDIRVDATHQTTHTEAAIFALGATEIMYMGSQDNKSPKNRITRAADSWAALEWG